MKIDDVLTQDERFDLWAEMMALSTATNRAQQMRTTTCKTASVGSCVP